MDYETYGGFGGGGNGVGGGGGGYTGGNGGFICGGGGGSFNSDKNGINSTGNLGAGQCTIQLVIPIIKCSGSGKKRKRVIGIEKK